MQTERVRTAPSFTDGLKHLPLLLVSLFVAVGAVDLVLAMQPSLLLSLRADWQAAMPPGSGVSTLVAAAVITGAIALSALALTWFVRGVRAAPYLSLAPLWVGLCMLVIGRMTIELPIPLPTPAFVAICALLFVGSGVLFETRSTQNNAVGAGLSALPILLLILGYVLSNVAFDTNAMLLVLVLALAAAGGPAIAIACRASGAKLSGGFGAQQPDSSEQMLELLERARTAEERALRAEQQLGGQPAWAAAAVAPRLGLDDEELALSRRSGGPSWMPWAVAAGAVAVVGAGYALGYQPLATELADQRLRGAKEAEALAFEMNTLRASAAREKQALEEKLEAAYSAARQAGGSPGAGPGGSAPQASALALASGSSDETGRSRAADDDADEADSESGSAREAYADRKAQWAAEKEARRQERLAAREARRAERLAKREERLAARRARASSDSGGDATAGQEDDDDEEEEEERAARAAAREARAAEREAKAAERAAKREARAAERAEREAVEDEDEEEAPAPKSAPTPSAAEDSDDPLEGLDEL